MARSTTLSPAQKIDALAALSVLIGTGITLESAARMAVSMAGHKPMEDVDLGRAVDEFLLTRLKRESRQKTLEYYTENLNLLCRHFPDRSMSSFTVEDIEAWVHRVGGKSHSTMMARFRAARALWNWAALVRRPACANHEVFAGMSRRLNPKVASKKRKTAPYFTPSQAAELMQACEERHRPALALALFAGIRPDELGGENKPRLQWANVDLVAKSIRVPAEVSKTGAARVLSEGLPDAVWWWMPPASKKPVGDVLPIKWRSLRLSTAAKARWFHEADGKRVWVTRWKQDAARHSFATHMLALTQNSTLVSELLGHEGNPTLLKTQYDGVGIMDEAKAYFGIAPV